MSFPGRFREIVVRIKAYGELSPHHEKFRGENSMDEPISLNIGNICGGAVPEVFGREVAEILENIADLNTDPEAKRQIVLTFDFAPSPDRKSAIVRFSCKSKSAPVDSVSGTIFFSKRLGQMQAFTEDPRQTALFAKEPSATPSEQ